LLHLLIQSVLGQTTVQRQTIAQGLTMSGNELLTNPTFLAGASGWILRDAVVLPQETHNTGNMIQLNGVTPGPESWSHVGVSLQAIPCNHKLNFSCWLRAKTQGQKILVNAFAYDGKKLVMNWTAETSLNKDTWKRFDSSYVVPTGATSLSIWVVDMTDKPAYVSQASLTVGNAQTATTISASLDVRNLDPLATTVLLAKVTRSVRTTNGAETGVITFPIPGLYREQVPLTFDLKTKPATALVNYSVHKREDGRNWICEVNVRPPARGVIVYWESLVLVCGRKEPVLPKGKVSAPPDVAQWTRSTVCVQSDDPAIRAKAEALASGTDDVESYARKVMAFTSTNRGTGANFDALDAKQALACGGSCTSRANLAAALLRAHGIPARTISHLPAWYTGPLYEHWLVEYWHPGVGWVWMEPTLGRFQPAPNKIVVLAASNPEDEDKALDPIHLRSIMPGAAYLAGDEFSKDLIQSDLAGHSTNSAVVQGQIKGSPSEMKTLLDIAQQAFTRLSKSGESGHCKSRTEAIRLAAQHGKAIELSAAVKIE
jgi:hypothetical protein